MLSIADKSAEHFGSLYVRLVVDWLHMGRRFAASTALRARPRTPACGSLEGRQALRLALLPYAVGPLEALVAQPTQAEATIGLHISPQASLSPLAGLVLLLGLQEQARDLAVFFLACVGGVRDGAPGGVSVELVRKPFSVAFRARQGAELIGGGRAPSSVPFSHGRVCGDVSRSWSPI